MRLPSRFVVATLAALASAIVLGGCGSSPPPQPHILVILTDDQGWGDLSIHGNPDIQTPRLDALARSGVRFDRFYVSPLCSPTRAAFAVAV